MQEDKILILYFLSILYQPIQELILYILFTAKICYLIIKRFSCQFRMIIEKLRYILNQLKRWGSEKLSNDVISNISKYCGNQKKIRLKLLNKNLNEKIKITRIDCGNIVKPGTFYHNIDYLICYLTGKYWSKYFINDETLLNYPDLKVLDITGNPDITFGSLNKLNLRRLIISNAELDNENMNQIICCTKLLKTVWWEIKK